MYHVPLAFLSIYGRSDEGGENGDGEKSEISGGRERGDNLLLCCESVGCFVEV